GLAAIALCEAYALTGDIRLRMPAQRGLDYIGYAQDPRGGGWRYSARQAGDTSVTGWQIMALKSGQMAGLTVSSDVLKKAERFLDSVEGPSRGTFKYLPDDQRETSTMTAVGLLCRQYLGVGPRNPALLSGV